MSTRESQRPARRSRSPPHLSDGRETQIRHRSRSPRPRRHAHSQKRNRSKPSIPIVLPLQAALLRKQDFENYRPMFGLYLDIQKQLVLEELPYDQVRGRWKSFVGKWNRGELAEGWYDPATLQKAQASAAFNPPTIASQTLARDSPVQSSQSRGDESSEDDVVGPAIPDSKLSVYKASRKSGPAIPDFQDLELQRELQTEDLLGRRQELQRMRLLDRKKQKEHLDELVPRAEAGSKDRMLEKKREKADNNRAFASAKTEAGGVEDVPEADLLGDADGGVEGFKKQKRELERKKNDREVRREEILRVRQEEREQRIQEYKTKEEKTMSGLVALAKARFG